VYGKSVRITRCNVEALLDLSARYAVPPLRRRCCAFLAASADATSACALLAVADRYDCTALRSALLAAVLRAFPETCSPEAEGFLNVSASATHVYISLISVMLSERYTSMCIFVNTAAGCH
jgi:hypothetical protein